VCSHVHNHKISNELCDKVIDEVSSYVSHYLNGTIKTGDDLFINELSRILSIKIFNYSSFRALGHVVCGYNTIMSSNSSKCRLDSTDIIQPPFFKR